MWTRTRGGRQNGDRLKVVDCKRLVQLHYSSVKAAQGWKRLGAEMVMLYPMYRMPELDRQIETLRRFKEVVADSLSRSAGCPLKGPANSPIPTGLAGTWPVLPYGPGEPSQAKSSWAASRGNGEWDLF